MHVEVLHSHMTLSQVKDKFKRDTLIFLLQMRIFLNKDFIYIYIYTKLINKICSQCRTFSVLTQKKNI